MATAAGGTHRTGMHSFWNFYFFLRIVNKCDNTDTENIKLIVLTFILCN